ncbi:unnamed protein product [Parnassius apollo]|uniref:(apollo) hypothetical protein n=1 Tax=Parnassius apollo TaxID=110799 RepID=A0A8S3XKX1_PARAO|nr:unnamed protein product [Parnassius apollo]
MKSLVVFFALAAVACGSIIPWAQPVHHSAIVLDPHGRPLDTAEVINARALHLQAKALEGHGALVHAAVAPVAVAPVVHSVVAAPAAVSHQSRVDVRHSPAVVTAHTAPVVGVHSAYAPLLGLSVGLAGHGHLLKKRSLSHYVYTVPQAVSHQSRVDVVSSPAVVSHAVAAPVVAHTAYAPVAHAIAPAAVSHQSRVDVRTSPAVVTAHAAPIVAVHSAYAPLLGHSVGFAGHGHLLKKRSLSHYVYTAPEAVSHQSRVDVRTSPAVVSHAIAAPVVAHTAYAPVAHAIAPAAVTHQSRVDVRTSPAVVAHSVLAAPLTYGVVAAPYAHSGLLHSAHLGHAL